MRQGRLVLAGLCAIAALAVVVPAGSLQETRPGLPAPSAQEKLVVTVWSSE